jgi:ribosomal protein S1
LPHKAAVLRHVWVCRDCKVVGCAPFGVFVEILPGADGLVHVSELDMAYAETDDWSVGDTMDVKCLEVQPL